MRMQVSASVGISVLVPGFLAGLIGLGVGIAGHRDVSTPAPLVSHHNRLTVPSTTVAGPKTQLVEGQYCRPVWWTKGADDLKAEGCSPLPATARLVQM